MVLLCRVTLSPDLIELLIILFANVIVLLSQTVTDLQIQLYRGISLLSIISKCFTSILNKRLYTWLEENSKISESQAGFRKNYSTTDQIFNISLT